MGKVPGKMLIDLRICRRKIMGSEPIPPCCPSSKILMRRLISFRLEPAPLLRQACLLGCSLRATHFTSQTGNTIHCQHLNDRLARAMVSFIHQMIMIAIFTGMAYALYHANAKLHVVRTLFCARGSSEYNLVRQSCLNCFSLRAGALLFVQRSTVLQLQSQNMIMDIMRVTWVRSTTFSN